MLFNKERNGCEQVYRFERRKSFEGIIKQLILNSAFVEYEVGGFYPPVPRPSALVDKNRELKQTTTTTTTRTSPNKRFNEQNNSCARAL